MIKRIVIAVFILLVLCVSVSAQQAQPQTQTRGHYKDKAKKDIVVTINVTKLLNKVNDNWMLIFLFAWLFDNYLALNPKLKSNCFVHLAYKMLKNGIPILKIPSLEKTLTPITCPEPNKVEDKIEPKGEST